MGRGSWLGFGAGALVLFATSVSHAECTMDTECKGDRVCDHGQCVAPPASTAPAAAAPAVAAAPVAVAPTAPAPLPVAVAPPAPKMVRHSAGMMAGGIVMVSLSPVALLVALGASVSQSLCKTTNDYSYDSSTGTTYNPRTDCNNDGLIYGSLLTAAALVGVGVPLIVIGAKKEPEGTAVIAPWATPTAAGLGLRVNL